MDYKFTTIDDEGEETEHYVPGKNEVCQDCDGEGYVLCEGMRGHAYSVEEFAESFDDEEADEYFKRGGVYDVVCQTCEGRNVVTVPDLETCSEEQKKLVEKHLEDEADAAREEADDRRTRWYEDGCPE